MAINEPLKRAISEIKLTAKIKQAEIANKLEVKSTYLSDMINGRVPLSESISEKIYELFHIRVSNFDMANQTGGEMFKLNPIQSNAKEIDPNYVEVPLVTIKAQAGYLNGFDDVKFIEELPRVQVLADRTFRGKYMCFEVSGDSMNDGTLRSICDGDTILGREIKRDLWCYKIHFNQWFFVINHIDGLLVKQIVEHDVEKGTITCHSLNPVYGPDFELNLSEVRELYNVIKITDRVLRF